MSQCIQTNERNELKGRIMNEGGTSQETVRVIQKWFKESTQSQHQ